MEINAIEMFGYVASVMVALSLTMKDIVRLRVLNLIGCALFASYGLMIDAWPVAATNGFIAVVNVYYLTKMWLNKNQKQAPLSKARA
ncbi:MULTISPECIES: hypothetical protein [unclassified Vibrio]|uniref:Uroporphyrinogen decarboxylase n=1 Tax=Vibrio sp. HB236076 TaxID=3232307 RepID=A0AB39HIM4_9VIBR|nr:hypothetical protein [Vibrio sp. HB161653]MDP5252849.1 hypothetical protein [Vibrio sp. HB161653]